MGDRVDQYTPEIPDAHWAAIDGFVRESVRAAGPHTPYSVPALLNAVCGLTHWAWLRGEPLDRLVVFDRWLIELFIAQGCPTTWSPASRGNRRSILFRVSEALLGHKARTPRVAALPSADPSKPYTSAEITAFRSWAHTQTTPHKQRDCRALLAFGFGAGLAAEDLLDLRRRDVVRFDGTFVVTVTGRRAREVPMLAVWADDVSTVLAALGADEFVFRQRRRGVAKNALSNFLANTTGVVKPNPQRMRATWIVGHLAAGTPVKALMGAAGVQSLEAFTRFVQFVPDLAPVDARRLLSGVPA